MRNNISYTVSNKLCTGCGVCEEVCPKHCIRIKCIDKEYRPVVDVQYCLGEKCGRCLKVCPGIGIALRNKSRELFQDSNVKDDKYIGIYISLYTGYSKDADIRFHSASGGMVSQFLIFLLEKKIIDGALVTGFADDHITPVSYIARTKEEVIAARSSKYCPVSLNNVGNEIIKAKGRFIIVGLPCHIQGFRKRAEIDRQFRENVIGYFAIYCSSNRSFNARDYLIKSYHIKKDDISYFAFRDEGCLGCMKILTKTTKETKIPYTQYYGRLRSYFKPHRCLTCIDHYGELADVCFGDIHIKPYSDDTIGVSSWIVRSVFWDNLFLQAALEGYIKMDSLEPAVLNRSQAEMLFPNKRRAKAVMNIDKLLGRDVAKYDINLDNPNLLDYVKIIVCHMQRFVGRRPYLWFIINLIDKSINYYGRTLFKIRGYKLW